ncbi:MAG: hypothetical protein U5K00_13695 [Melioribacteraceae bacterium]|nr:hypothetical protein [Melioribacteraceae bacterium]
MFDDGQEGNGDDQAGDGVYSRIIEIAPANQKGIIDLNLKPLTESVKLAIKLFTH